MVEHRLTDYLSCEVMLSRDKRKAWVGQPHMVKKLRNKFGDMVKGMQKYKTPGSPGKGLMLERDPEFIIDPDHHALYRTGVGMLLYLIKYSQPEICNAVWELSKCLSGPNEAAFKEKLRVIKYILDSPTKGLKMQPIKADKWLVVLFTDSDWAGDKDTRKSVRLYIVCLWCIGELEI